MTELGDIITNIEHIKLDESERTLLSQFDFHLNGTIGVLFASLEILAENPESEAALRNLKNVNDFLIDRMFVLDSIESDLATHANPHLQTLAKLIPTIVDLLSGYVGRIAQALDSKSYAQQFQSVQNLHKSSKSLMLAVQNNPAWAAFEATINTTERTSLAGFLNSRSKDT